VIDFGIPGDLVAILIIGFLHTLLYRKALTGSFLANLLFALFMFPVAMAIQRSILFAGKLHQRTSFWSNLYPPAILADSVAALPQQGVWGSG
jgi:hypothetical protein